MCMFRLHVRYIFPSELTGTRIILPRLGRLYRTCQRLRQLARFPKNPITEPFFSLLSLSQPAAFLSAGFFFSEQDACDCDWCFRLRKRRMKRNGRLRACLRMADRWRSAIMCGCVLAFVIQQRSYEKSRMRSRQSTLAVSHGMPITNTCPSAS